MLNRYLKLWLLMLFCLPAFAWAEFRPFYSDSLDDITSAREGQPFLLVLWSIDCPPCRKELQSIGRIYSEFSPGGLVLILTDGSDGAVQAKKMLAGLGLASAESWLFADSFPERLRYHIDPDWYGELPRSYFYDGGHRRTAQSGTYRLSELQRLAMLTKNIGPAASLQGGPDVD